MKGFSLYGIEFESADARLLAKRTIGLIRCARGAMIFTPNLKILCSARRSREIRELLGRADLLYPDGVGVSLLCRLNGFSRVPRVTGIDMGYFVLRYAAKHGLRVFLLGAREGVAERAKKNLKAQIKGLNICGVHHGYFDKSSKTQNADVIKKIQSASPDILFVCFGFPMQEKWVSESICDLSSVRVSLCLGGALDVWSGDVKRAPMAFRVMNLEWLWRIGAKGLKRVSKAKPCQN